MPEKILVVTDNSTMAFSFKEISEELGIKAPIDYAISPFSNERDFVIEKKINVFDLTNIDCVDFIIKEYSLVFSIHCKQLFPVKLVKSVRCVNVHPGYNPHNRGWYPQVFSILNDGILGATIHEIDEELDNGHIIARKKIDLFDYDTSLTAYNKVLEAEKDLLRENLIRIVDEDYLAFPPEFKGELKLKRDFNDLLEIDLDKKMTIRETLKYLRALSHGNFKNAYYLSETGKKVFVSLNLSVE